MAAPTRVAVSPATSFTSGTTKTTGTLTWLTGDVIVVLGMTSDNSQLMATPTNTGTALTFNVVSGTPTTTASSCKGYAWVAIAGADSSGTISAVADSADSGIVAFQYRASDGLGATAISASLGATTTQSLVRGGNNSAVAQIWGDWNAVNDTTVTWTPASGNTQDVAVFTTGSTIFAGDWTDEGSAGTTDYGFSGFAGGDMTAITLEILGTAGGGETITLDKWAGYQVVIPSTYRIVSSGFVPPSDPE